MKDSLANLWEHRDFIVSTVKRNYQSKYKRSILGVFWSFMQPLAMILIYTLVFSQVMKSRLPDIDSGFAYSIYLCSGILIWNFFSEVSNRCQSIFIDNADIIKKLNFPRLCLIIVIWLDSAINLLIFCVLFVLFLIISGNFPSLSVLYFIPVLVVLSFFVLGLGVLVGVLNVFFRDVGFFFQIVLQFWFWLTPIVYPITIIPETYRAFFLFNPMTIIVSSTQSIFVYDNAPNVYPLLILFLFSLLLCFIAAKLYRVKSAEMVEEL